MNGQVRFVLLKSRKAAISFSSCASSGRVWRTSIVDWLSVISSPDLTAWVFANEAGHILGDVNYVHPFREGNGRTQLVYLEQLAKKAGHPLDLTKIDMSQWMQASREAHLGRYQAMSRCIERAIDVSR